MTDLLSKKLPCELVDVIKLYTGEGCWRNGKYINRFSKEDPRYKMLRKKPKIKQIKSGSYPFSVKGCTWFKYPNGKFAVIFVGNREFWKGRYINDHIWEMSYNKTNTLVQIR